MLNATEASCIAITLWWRLSVLPRRTLRVLAAAASSLAETVATRPSSTEPKPSCGATVEGPAGACVIFGRGASMRPSELAESGLTEPRGDMGVGDGGYFPISSAFIAIWREFLTTERLAS